MILARTKCWHTLYNFLSSRIWSYEYENLGKRCWNSFVKCFLPQTTNSTNATKSTISQSDIKENNLAFHLANVEKNISFSSYNKNRINSINNLLNKKCRTGLTKCTLEIFSILGWKSQICWHKKEDWQILAI